MTAEDKAEEALLAAEAAILFKVAGLPGPDYYSIHVLRALVYLGSCARGARDPPLSQGSIPGAEPPHPPGAPRSRHPICGHIVVTQTHLSCVTAHSGRRFDPAAFDQHVWLQASD